MWKKRAVGRTTRIGTKWADFAGSGQSWTIILRYRRVHGPTHPGRVTDPVTAENGGVSDHHQPSPSPNFFRDVSLENSISRSTWISTLQFSVFRKGRWFKPRYRPRQRGCPSHRLEPLTRIRGILGGRPIQPSVYRPCIRGPRAIALEEQWRVINRWLRRAVDRSVRGSIRSTPFDGGGGNYLDSRGGRRPIRGELGQVSKHLHSPGSKRSCTRRVW